MTLNDFLRSFQLYDSLAVDDIMTIAVPVIRYVAIDGSSALSTFKSRLQKHDFFSRPY